MKLNQNWNCRLCFLNGIEARTFGCYCHKPNSIFFLFFFFLKYYLRGDEYYHFKTTQLKNAKTLGAPKLFFLRNCSLSPEVTFVSIRLLLFRSKLISIFPWPKLGSFFNELFHNPELNSPAQS